MKRFFFLMLVIVVPLMMILPRLAEPNTTQGHAMLQTDLQNDPHLLSIGNPEGDVTVVEFFDYHCGYCKQFEGTLDALVAQDKNIRVVFKELPILGENSVLATQAALAVASIAPKHYYAFHKSLMASHETFTPQSLTEKAKAVGVTLAPFEKTTGTPDIAKTIASTLNLARSLGIHGTPALVVGTQVIHGGIDLEALKSAVADARSAATAAKH